MRSTSAKIMKKLTGSPNAADIAALFNSDVCKNLSNEAVMNPFKVQPDNMHTNQLTNITFLFNGVISSNKTKTHTAKHVKPTWTPIPVHTQRV